VRQSEGRANKVDSRSRAASSEEERVRIQKGKEGANPSPTSCASVPRDQGWCLCQVTSLFSARWLLLEANFGEFPF